MRPYRGPREAKIIDHMITISKCRELLGDAGAGLSDGQILALRGQLYALADVVTDMYIEQHEAVEPKPTADGDNPEWN